MYKLLALDMDGTLLNREKIITEEVGREINQLLDSKKEVTLATGRFPASVWLHAKTMNLTCPLVALNGAIILDSGSGEPIHTTPIKQDVAVRIAEFAEQNDVYVHFYGYNILVVHEINEMNEKWALANVVVDSTKELLAGNYSDQLAHFSIREVGSLARFLHNSDLPVFKATIINNDPEHVETLFQEISKWSELSVTRTGKRRFDINAAGVSKKTALIKICEERNISSQEVVAVGDFDNDAEMIKWAGLGIAMGNSNDLIKEVANAITLTNDEHGVAHVIKTYLT